VIRTSSAASVPEKRSHKKLDPEIKALRAIDRALSELPDEASRRRVMEWVVARGLSKTWITLARFRWITGERDAA
jgi:hypothetical protein